MALKKRKSKLSELFPEREAIRVKPITKKPTVSSSTNISRYNSAK